MSNKKNKQGSSKKKTIIIVSSVLVVFIGLGAGLGVAFGGTSEKSSDVIQTENTNVETYWKITTEKDPSDSNKQIKTLRITKEVKTEQHLKSAYDNMVAKNVDITSFNELLLPYHLKTVGEDKIKNTLKMESFNIDNIGYILHEEDYKESIAISGTSGTGGYKNQKIVEISLSKVTEKIPNYTFYNNKIRKVNWSDLTKLTSIGNTAFYNNKLTGDLDLSKLTLLTLIDDNAFNSNNINGSLILPPNIITIGEKAFNSVAYYTNKIKGTLKLPKTLKSMGKEAFTSNIIEIIDWSEADALETIGSNSFSNNKLKTLQFNATILPKIKEIGNYAFDANPGQNGGKEFFIENFTLPPSLKTMGTGAIRVKDGITITVSANSTGVTVDSFRGEPIIKRP